MLSRKANPLLSLLDIQHVSAADSYLYASPTGSGTVCSLASPCSLTGARDKVRTINGSMSGNIYVYLRGGNYALTSTFALNETDSGNNGYSVIYTKYLNEAPVINGGKQITGWTSVAGTSLYKAAVTGVSDFRQVYVNGKSAQRARSASRVKGTAWYDDTTDPKSTKDGIYVNDNELGYWENAGDMELHFTQQWQNMYFSVQSILAGGTGQKIIRMKQPYFYRGTFMGTIGTGVSNYDNPFYLENAYELLDSPGEWYFKKSTNELFYYPKSGENMGTVVVEVPILEKMLTLYGSSNTNKVHNVMFDSLTFKLGSWLDPSQKAFAGWQSEFIFHEAPTDGSLYDDMVPGNIELNCAQYITFKNSTIMNMGAVGIRLVNSSLNVDIIGNVFRDMAGAAVTVGHFQHDAETYPNPSPPPYAILLNKEVNKNNTIKNNVITRIGEMYWGSPAISGFFVDGLVISHNDISNIPYTGISVGWGWSNFPNSTTSRNNIIEYNAIDNYMQKARDGGGIYTLGQQPNSKVRYNVVKNGNYAGSSAAYYHDEGSAYYETYNNVADNDSGSGWFNAWTTSIHDITVHDNYSRTPRYFNNGTNVTVTNTTVVPDGNWPPVAAGIIYNAGVEAAYKGLLTVKADPSPPPVPTEGLVSWVKADAGVIKNGSNKVSDWGDQSNKGNGYMQRDTTQQPLYVASAVNGYPAIRFDGVNDNLLSHSIRWLSDNFTVIMVMKPTALTDHNQQFLATTWGKYVFHTAANGGIYTGVDVSNRINPSDGPGAGTMVNNTWQQFAYTFGYEYSPNPASTTPWDSNQVGRAKLYKNGNLLASKQLVYNIATEDWTQFSLGTSNVNTIQGDLAEVLIYSRTLTDGERKTVENYLNAKYISAAMPTPTPTPGATVTVTDPASDFSKVMAKSANLIIDGSYLSSFENDTGRFQRTTDTAEWIVYKYSNIINTKVKLYYYGTTQPPIYVYTSTDGYTWQSAQGKSDTPVSIDAYWKRVNITFASIPEYTNYIKIEYGINGAAWYPEIGQVEISHVPGGYNTAVDDNSGFTKVYSKTANWMIDSSYLSSFENDAGRFQRTTDTAENVVYNYNNVKMGKVRMYYYGATQPPLNAYVSSDGSSWQSVTGIADTTVSIDAYWKRLNITFSSIPNGMNFIKFEVPANGFFWYPELGQINVSYVPGGVTIDDANAGMVYSGSWPLSTYAGMIHDTYHQNNVTNDYFQYTFTGTSVSWITSRDSNRGFADIYIDGVLQTSKDTYSPVLTLQEVMYTKSGLTSGSHTIKVVVKGTKHASSSGYYILQDAFQFSN